MFLDFNSQKSWPAEVVVTASGSCSPRTSGGPRLETTALEDRKKIQNYLDRMEHWAESNRMKFSREKCKILHLRKRNPLHSYKMGETWLSKTTSKKDLGIVVDQKLNMSQPCDAAAKKANVILGCINRSIVPKLCDVLVTC